MWVARLMRGLSFNTIETVATETFASRATSRMEIFFSSPGGVRPWRGAVAEVLFGILVKQFTYVLNCVKLARKKRLVRLAALRRGIDDLTNQLNRLNCMSVGPVHLCACAHRGPCRGEG
jgi:hypothetical protein